MSQRVTSADLLISGGEMSSGFSSRLRIFAVLGAATLGSLRTLDGVLNGAPGGQEPPDVPSRAHERKDESVGRRRHTD